MPARATASVLGQEIVDKFYRFQWSAEESAIRRREAGDEDAATYHSGRAAAWEDAIDSLHEVFVLKKRRRGRNRYKGF